MPEDKLSQTQPVLLSPSGFSVVPEGMMITLFWNPLDPTEVSMHFNTESYAHIHKKRLGIGWCNPLLSALFLLVMITGCQRA
ncbi:MAG: hypothetical protein ACOCW9_01665, partial [Thermodesulfobacteriota bacterium]